MKKTLTLLTSCLVILLTLTSGVHAQFEVAFPFIETQVKDYYIKSKITDSRTQNSQIAHLYKKDNTVIVISEIRDQKFAFGYNEEEEEDWIPDIKEHLGLIFSNYEIKLVQVETVAKRDVLVVELIHKQSNTLRHKYLLDQETGLALSRYIYDRNGQLITSYEALEVDYNPDFSSVDLDSVEYVHIPTNYQINDQELQALLPWINPYALDLPEEFKVVGYSQVDSNPPNILIWTTDGYETLVLEVTSTSEGQIEINADSELEIIERIPSLIMAQVVDQPIVLSLRGLELGVKEAENLLLSTSPIRKITNPEALRAKMYVKDMLLSYPFDYDTIPREELSKEEFFELAPMAFQGPTKFPQGFEVVGYAKIHYSEEQKNSLPIYDEYPNLDLEDYLITLSDGVHVHHVGLSFAPNYTEYKHSGQSIQHFNSWVAVVFKGWPISFFSHSDFLSYEEQHEIICQLGQGYVINPKN